MGHYHKPHTHGDATIDITQLNPFSQWTTPLGSGQQQLTRTADQEKENQPRLLRRLIRSTVACVCTLLRRSSSQAAGYCEQATWDSAA